MDSVWTETLVSVGIVSLVSLIGVFIISFGDEESVKNPNHTLLRFLVALAIGVLLGDLFIHLLPEIYKEIGIKSSFYVMGGFIVFFLLERVLHWRHKHRASRKNRIEPLGVMNLVADGVHNLIDGALVAASYLVSFPVGLATTIAVVVHEIPQELGDYGILRMAGFSKKTALILNFASGLLAIIGAIIVLSGGINLEVGGPLILAFASGGFIYLVFLLIRKLEDEMAFRHAFTTVLAIVAGIASMWLITFLE